MNLETPLTKFDSKVPTEKEIQEIEKSAKSGSAPWASGVPYLLCKNVQIFLNICGVL